MSDIDIVIGAQDKASAVLNNIAGKVTGFAGPLASLGPIAIGVGAAVAGAAAAFVSLNAAITAVDESRQRIDELAKTAKSIGSSVSDLSAMQAALRQMSGAEVDDVNSALKEMQLRIGEMASGIGSQEQLDIMSQLGLDPKSLATMDPVAQFQKIHDAIVRIKNTSERSSVADKLLGGDSVYLLAAFNAEVGELESKMASAAERGLALSDAQAAGVEEMNNAITRVQATTSGLVDQLTAELAPVIITIANGLEEWIPPLVAFSKTYLPEAIDGVVVLSGWVADTTEALVRMSLLDFGGAFEAATQNSAEAWLQGVVDARMDAAKAALKAEQDRLALAQAAQPVDMAAVTAAKARAKAAQDTITALERELKVAEQGADAVTRQEQLALATNDAERERIQILQEQIAEQERMNKLIEEQAKAAEQAAKERDKKIEDRRKELEDRDKKISGFTPGVGATEGRLLTRGRGEQDLAKIARLGEAQVTWLQRIERAVSQNDPNFDPIVLEVVG